MEYVILPTIVMIYIPYSPNDSNPDPEYKDIIEGMEKLSIYLSYLTFGAQNRWGVSYGNEVASVSINLYSTTLGLAERRHLIYPCTQIGVAMERKAPVVMK